MFRTATAAAAAVLFFATTLPAQTVRTATVQMIDTTGARIGTVELQETPSYGVWLRVDLEGLSPGVHGFHIHETGTCDAPSFDGAGGHYAPRGHDHGMLHPHGKHAGDLLNLHVPASGRVQTERLAQHVTLVRGAHASLLDQDGSALVIHANADDYNSQPSGGGGTKVACGVIRP